MLYSAAQAGLQLVEGANPWIIRRADGATVQGADVIAAALVEQPKLAGPSDVVADRRAEVAAAGAAGVGGGGGIGGGDGGGDGGQDGGGGAGGNDGAADGGGGAADGGGGRSSSDEGCACGVATSLGRGPAGAAASAGAWLFGLLGLATLRRRGGR